MKGEHEQLIAAWLDQVCRDDIHGNAFKVGYRIAAYINRKSRIAWPSQGTIAKETNLSEAAVKRMIARLRSRGHLDVDPGANRGRSSRYRLTIKEGVHFCTPSENGKGFNPDKEGVHFCTERGSAVNPDLLIPSEEEGRGRNGAQAREPSRRAPDGAPKVAPLDGYTELRQVWNRPAGENDVDARREYEKQISNGQSHADILCGARAWVTAHHPSRASYLPALERWLRNQRWREEPPIRKKQSRTVRGGNNHTPSLANIAKAYGIHSARQRDGTQ